MNNYDYSERVDKALGHSYSKHRTLRSCLDPGSHEWSETTIEKRVEVLKKVVADGNDLGQIFLDYRVKYKEMNKPHVVENLEHGLTELLQYLLSQ